MMDETQFKVDIEVLKERCNNLFGQLNRFVSHLESEQRVTGNISKSVERVQHQVDKIEKILEKKEDTGRWRWDTFIAIVSVIANMVLGMMMLLNK